MARQLQRQLELRWYPDWRWRFTRDEAGIAVWCGRMGLYVWRTEYRRQTHPAESPALADP